MKMDFSAQFIPGNFLKIVQMIFAHVNSISTFAKHLIKGFYIGCAHSRLVDFQNNC